MTTNDCQPKLGIVKLKSKQTNQEKTMDVRSDRAVSHPWPRRAWAGVLALCLSPLIGTAGAADLHYTFDTDAQGFTLVDGGAAVTATGAYLALQDTASNDFAVQLPAVDLGDWSRFLGGSFAFDAINLNQASTDWGTFGTLRIASGSLAVELDIVPTPAPAATWTTYSVTLDQATWGPSLATILNQVTQVSLTLESHAGFDAGSGYELNGLDNVKVSAVPETETWALFTLGVLGVVALQRRRAQG
jgi:hypothetical protein